MKWKFFETLFLFLSRVSQCPVTLNMATQGPKVASAPPWTGRVPSSLPCFYPPLIFPYHPLNLGFTASFVFFHCDICVLAWILRKHLFCVTPAHLHICGAETTSLGAIHGLLFVFIEARQNGPLQLSFRVSQMLCRACFSWWWDVRNRGYILSMWDKSGQVNYAHVCVWWGSPGLKNFNCCWSNGQRAAFIYTF